MALRRAALLAYVAGVLLIIAGFSGGTGLLQLGDRLAREYLPADIAVTTHLAITLLVFIAGLGGVAVIVGGMLWTRAWERTGGLFVGLGAGVGALGLVLLLAVSLLSGRAAQFLVWLLGPAGVGVLLSILARREASR
jgi:hypothetical protein